MIRRDIDDSVTEITSGDTCDRWLVIRRMLDATSISIQVFLTPHLCAVVHVFVNPVIQ